MKQFNVAGRKYTKVINKQERQIIATGIELREIYKLIADLRHDLDSTAKIQGNMLKRETDRIARLEVL